MEPQDWEGLVARRGASRVDVFVRAVVHAAPVSSAASPFLAVLSSGDRSWVKCPFPGLAKAPVTELVVGRLGALIGAPVCQVQPVAVTSSLLPYELRPGVSLVAGVGTATTDVPGTPTEIRTELTRRYDDNNRVRHAGVFALVDWCFGSDLQWLQRVDADWELHSHDHGWYFPPGGPDWTTESLIAHVDVPCQITGDPSGLDIDEVARLADALDAVTRDQLREIMEGVPAQMPATDRELEILGWFLERRAPSVAARLRLMMGGIA